jgi:Zn2+/Cd2+-exporting ATPase
VTTTCTVCELHAESTFKIEGMDCREEVKLLERRFKTLAGVEDFSADVMGQRLHVKYDAARLTTDTITDAVADTGMRAWLEHEEPVAATPSAERTRRYLVWASGTALALGLAAEQLPAAGAAAPFLFAAAIATGLGAVGRRAWNSVRAGVLDINVLMVLAVAGAIVLQQYSEAATVIFLFAVAQALEARTLERARLAITALMDLTPADALVRDESGEHRVGVDAIRPGAVVVIKPGEKIPLDGSVVAGHSEVNQSPVTGESLPIEKTPGDEVFAGTINGRGALEVRVTKLRRDTTLARIIHLVERAQAQRAPAQTTVERFARVYTPLVIALAVAVAIVPPLLLAASWPEWLYRALVLLVVSCPCALVISTPVSIVAALASAARKGVLIKGGLHLERTSAVKCVAFDKTGTLTRGAPEVVDLVALNGAPPADVVDLAASVERRSTHPIAQAILRYAGRDGGGGAAAAERVTAHPGRGTEGVVGGQNVMLGNHRLFEERSLCSPEIHDRLAEMGAAGRTPVLVAHGGQAIGILAIADRAREVSRATVDLLKEQGIKRVVMLTGDSRATAAAIGSELGVDEIRAELLPEDKVAAVEELRRRYGAVAMVGDGVNDAPALAAADVGIAMGAAGSDAALETADIALMADELMKIPYAFRLSRATVRNIKANLAISVVLKAAFIAAAVTGVATLWMAVLADTGASVIVIANALRLLRAD